MLRTCCRMFLHVQLDYKTPRIRHYKRANVRTNTPLVTPSCPIHIRQIVNNKSLSRVSRMDPRAPKGGITIYDASPSIQQPPKEVAFELLFDWNNNERARLPMRVRIYPHDTTDSIVSTVRDFYGLYAGVAKGISFEDGTGMTLIARYENFTNNMVVYVRVVPDYTQSWQQSPYQAPSHTATPISAKRTPHLDAGFEVVSQQAAQATAFGQHASRPPSRVSRKQSASPRHRQKLSKRVCTERAFSNRYQKQR